MNRNTGRVNLYKTRICEESSLLITLDNRRTVAVHRVGGKEIRIAVSAGRDNYGMRAITLDFTCYKISHNDAARFAVDQNNVKHLATIIRFHRSGGNLAVQRAVRAKKQLLTGLTARVKGARNLRAAERAIGK